MLQRLNGVTLVTFVVIGIVMSNTILRFLFNVDSTFLNTIGWIFAGGILWLILVNVIKLLKKFVNYIND